MDFHVQRPDPVARRDLGDYARAVADFPTVRVAAVQAPPAVLDAEAGA